MIVWPKSLIREIAERRCILFLGAGVSASAMTGEGERPPSWAKFLEAASKLVHDNEKKSQIDALISNSNFLLALQAIYKASNEADYNELLNETFHRPPYQPSSLHEAIHNLDQRIVITTNFDRIYEAYCMKPENEGFKVIPYHSTSLADEIRSDRRLIIKAHGSIDDVRTMIFTKHQYHEAKKNHGKFYEILKALYLTHTCIFIGCGLSDPDINLLLEDVNILSTPSCPHYALLLKEENSEFCVDDWRETYNIQALFYDPDHTALEKSLVELFSHVDGLRMKINL